MARDRSRGPRGRTGPGRRPGAPRVPRAAATSTTGPVRPGGSAAATRPRSRLTMRAAVLVLVLAVLMLSYASSLRAYLQQRSHINDLKSSIAERNVAIDALEDEKRRWDDPAYVEQQARERLGYVMPGEKTYIVLGADGLPLEPVAELPDPTTVLRSTPQAWWDGAWDTMETAGDPPRIGKPPAAEIDGTGKGTGGEASRGEEPEAP